MSYTFSSGGSAFGLATDVYLVAINVDGGPPEDVTWLPEERVTDIPPSPIFSLTDYNKNYSNAETYSMSLLHNS